MNTNIPILALFNGESYIVKTSMDFQLRSKASFCPMRV